MKVAIAVLLLTYCQAHGDVMRRNERLWDANNASEASAASSKTASAGVKRGSEVAIDRQKGQVETVLERERRSDEELHLQRDHTGMYDIQRDVRSSEFEAFDGENDENDDEDIGEGIHDGERKIRSIAYDEYDKDDDEYYGNEALNGRVHNLFVVFDLSKKDAKAKAALIRMLQKLVENGDRIDTDDDNDNPEVTPNDNSDAIFPSPNFRHIMDFQYEDNEDNSGRVKVQGRGRQKTRQSKRRRYRKEKGKQIKQSLCHKKNKRMIAKREISGCKGAVEFSEMVCADYNACMSRNGNNCEALICPKFKTVSKRESCYNQLFDCDN